MVGVKAEYERQGFLHLPQAIARAEVEALIAALSVFDAEMNNYGVRNLMNKVPHVRRLANAEPLVSIAREVLGDRARPIRAVYFDKVPTANWSVAWHQDTSIAVTARAELEGFGPWSVKQGVPHVEPPAEYLRNILTLRLHLDAADQENGALRVIAATHDRGRIPSRELLEIVERSAVVECNVEPGDLLLMCPLTLHASRKSRRPSHRRIVHIEYSAMALPAPLEWYEAAG